MVTTFSPTIPISTLESQGAVIHTIVAATGTGSTDVLVVHFTGTTIQVGSIPVASWLTRSDSSTLGTTCTIIQPGVYQASLYIPWTISRPLGSYITLNATTAQRQNTVPQPNSVTVYSAQFSNITSTYQAIMPLATIVIDSTMIANGDNVIRFGAADIENAPTAVAPATADWLVPSTTSARIFKVGNAR